MSFNGFVIVGKYKYRIL